MNFPNKNIFYVGAAGILIGGLLVYFLAPNKIKIVEKEKIVVKYVETQHTEQTHQEKTKVTKPDGTIIEKETTQTGLSDISLNLEHEVSKETEKTITNFNKKQFLIYGGVNPLDRKNFVVGSSYNFLGPLDVGLSYSDHVFFTVGIRF